MDFYKITQSITKRDHVEISPDYKVCRSKDLMVRGRSFYAIWDEEAGLWSTDILDVQRLVDQDLDKYVEKQKDHIDGKIDIKYLGSEKTKRWRDFQKHLADMPDSYHQLDTKMTFANTEVSKNDYVSKRLPYELKEGPIDTYLEFFEKLYKPEERQKFEWAIGSIIAGESTKIQKFFVFYGGPGTGKSTVINLIQTICDGYWCNIDVKGITQSNNQFALEMLKSNPLVAIQHDGDLSKIDDNTRLNSLVSHEPITMNEKFKAQYQMKPNCLLFVGTNTPVRITDGKSGLKRRLIDITPTGDKWSNSQYNKMNSKMLNFEIGAIAWHCLKVYEELGANYYKNYEPVEMMYKTDMFFNYVEDNYDIFKSQDSTTLKQAYNLYKEFTENADITYKLSKPDVREKLKDYFEEYKEEARFADGSHVRHAYSKFKSDLFNYGMSVEKEESVNESWLQFDIQKSLLDKELSECAAQYGNDSEAPNYKWTNVKTKLKDISTNKLHYVLFEDPHHIVIDFDIKDSSGKKSFKKNVEAASKWPKTYAELSKSGEGIHLHYIYDGDPNELSRLFDKDIEVKVFTGNSSLRRKLTKCNDIPIAHISTGLPLKAKGDTMVNFEAVSTEKHLRAIIKKNLKKEIHPSTKPSVDFIFHILEDAYTSGLKYDVTDMRPAILAFASNSTNQSEYCVKKVSEMHFKSEEPSENQEFINDNIVFYDVEVFPNLFLVNYKLRGKENQVVRLINPTPLDIEKLLKFKLVGFNCRRYDNHILHARLMGYSNEQLYRLSQRIINGSDNCFFAEAYNISYTDIYDYASKKQSLKLWEIELGIHHQELGLPWDQPVPEELWPKVAEYCDNDVIATEAVWNATQGDFLAREILSDIAGGCVNDTTNTLTGRLIFGKNKNPQGEFQYRDLSKPVQEIESGMMKFLTKYFPKMVNHWKDKGSVLPFFPGYSYDAGKSTYKGYDVGEGGFVWAKPGMYARTKTFDVISMHPHSAMAEYLFGLFTQIFHDLVQARIYIKHGDFESAGKLFDGKLAKYCTDKNQAKALAGALKIAINSVYGLTAAKFMNVFRDSRNKDNIVAKRGALFMIDLKEAVEAMGANVIHIKTDSIKIENPTPEIEEFVMNFGEWYGYSFEIEHVFEKICLVNNAVYIAKLAKDDEEWISDCKKAKEKNKPEPTRWTATGTQFAVPFVFKTLFSKEPLIFDDHCETKSVTTSLYLDMNESLPDISMYEKELEDRRKKGLMYKNTQLQGTTDSELESLISSGHDYRFVGKVGRFCPIKYGCGGGELMRQTVDKKTGIIGYSSATGCKDYRWLESELVKSMGKEKDIDESYYKKLVDNAVSEISQYGDFEWFTSEEDYAEEVPFDGGVIIK